MEENKKTTGQQTAGKEKESVKKAPAKRNEIGAKNQRILDFIMECTPFECDAIRVAYILVNTGTKVSNITEDDAEVINRYLNYGMRFAECNTDAGVMTHRQIKAYELAIKLGKFLPEKKDEMLLAPLTSGMLILFASTGKYVRAALEEVKHASQHNVNSHSASQSATASADSSQSVSPTYKQ